MYIPKLIPNAGKQTMFNESIKNRLTISVDSWYKDRKIVIDGLQFQIDIGSVQNKKCPNFLRATHQSLAWAHEHVYEKSEFYSIFW